MFSKDVFNLAVRRFLSAMPPLFRPTVVAACPFCEERGEGCLVFGGGESMSGAFAAHEEPQCPEFRELAPDEFFERARKKLQAQVAN